METPDLALARQTSLLYQMAQKLIEHDDFSILPQVSQAEQETFADSGIRPLVLVRRKWNTAQVVRLLPADRIGTGQIEQMLVQEALYLRQAKRQNGVRKMYSLTLFIFTHWRSDDNLNAIARTGAYAGMGKTTGAVAVGVDLARGVFGPAPWGPAAEDINLAGLAELVKQYAEAEENAAQGVEEPEQPLRTQDEWMEQMLVLSQAKREEVAETLKPNQKTPAVTTILVLTILVWLFGVQFPETVLGAFLLIPEAVRIGEWWRLLTSVFLHYDLTHIMFNMVTLYFFGRIAERIFGMPRFFVIYVLAGIAGSLLSVAFSPHNSLGASGAVFGLFGALLAFGQFNRKAFAMTIGTSVYALLAINLIFGFIMPNVNNFAHIGGLIGGFLTAMALGVPNTPNTKRWLFALLYAAFAALALWIGLTTPFR
ncbi:rhomboid family intramembrane serine protease [Tumebacillus avium]|uniref:rhomboid family intramembrane serine protease n=1 Tax=Tumebacillus avium TaxID=1903704 RepID=UPI0012FE5670|nr:rhomboid family intramembrane serine protease [Tumebacillus avium]